MKKAISFILILCLALTLFANGAKEEAKSSATKIGFVVINDESDQGYTWNFMNGMDAAIAKLKADGYNVELVVKRQTPDNNNQIIYDHNAELAEEGCKIIFNNSYGFEPSMLEVAALYPNIKFVSLTNCGSQVDDNPNTYNAFAAIYEGRYLAGVAAGMKLNQLLAEGKIKAPTVGYVGAFSFAEVISGMSAYFLGIRSVCPAATMKVYFVGTWGDATLEEAAAKALIDQGCVMISQHSDTTSPALAAQKAGVFHTGYNTDMTHAAPDASIISCRINWEPYFYNFIKNFMDGKENPSDYTGTLAEGAVAITALNTKIAAPGTAAKLAEVEADLKAGKIKVFDLSTFTIGGKTGTNDVMYDSFAAVSGNATYGGEFHESSLQSAPYFVGQIDGIEWLNAAY